PLPGGDVERHRCLLLLAPDEGLRGRAEPLSRLVDEIEHCPRRPPAMRAARCAAQLPGVRRFAKLNDREILVTRALAIDVAVELNGQTDRGSRTRWRARKRMK